MKSLVYKYLTFLFVSHLELYILYLKRRRCMHLKLFYRREDMESFLAFSIIGMIAGTIIISTCIILFVKVIKLKNDIADRDTAILELSRRV
jgi:hypothetical protein